MIPGLLPLLRGWKYVAYDYSDAYRRVPSGGEETLFKSDRPGWLVALTVTLDNPDALLTLKYVGRGGLSRRATISPRGLYRMGALTWTPGAPYLTRYDDTEGVYTVAFSPLPWLPYIESEVRVKAPPESPATIISWHVFTAVIEDRDAFKRSLKETLGASGVAEG